MSCQDYHRDTLLLDNGSLALDAPARELISKYAEEIRAGNQPKEYEFIERYTGQTQHEFIAQLNILTTMAMIGEERSRQMSEANASERTENVFEKSYEMLFSDDV